ncbi:hypothetical protein [Oceanobacillus halophilus]|uniref:hypothetical protein n=1 Tax=Oceanobacillus halophilus TaxID=930130 RepID=UPI00131473AD|nr:hypothetical protein [Oceanobacillus halophilus]
MKFFKKINRFPKALKSTKITNGMEHIREIEDPHAHSLQTYELFRMPSRYKGNRNYKIS